MKSSNEISKASSLNPSPENTILCMRCLSLALTMPTHEKRRPWASIGPADRPAIMKQITSDHLVRLLTDDAAASSNYYHFALATRELLKFV